MDIVRNMASSRNFIASTPAVHFDPHSDEFHKNPYPTYKILRDAAPVTYWDAGKSWLITDYGTVVSVLKDERFSIAPAPCSNYDKIDSAEDASILTIKRKLLAIGSKDKRQLLQYISPILSSQNKKMLDVITLAAKQATQRVVGRPGFDLVSDFSHPLSIKIITMLLGIPEKYIAIIIRFVRACLDILDPAAFYSPAEIHHRVLRINTGLDLIEKTISDRRKLRNGGLVIDDLINMRANSTLHSNADLKSLIGLLIFSGLDCISLLITNSIHAVLSHPKSYQMLRESGSLWPNAIKEVIRYDYFIKLGTPRYALEDCTFGNQLISRGERVYPIIAAAQRDPSVFNQPDELNIMRPSEKFIGFGHGDYSCVGQSLALLAAEAAARQLIDSIYPLFICGDPMYDLNHKTFRMITSLKLATDVADHRHFC